MRRIALGNIALNVDVCGRGPAVLLLHGFTGSMATWQPFTNAWPFFTTVAVDLLGHGASDSPVDEHRYRPERAVDDLLRLLDELAVGPFAVVGYSMGGRLALQLAVRLARDAPRRVWGVVLESSSPGIDGAEERRARARSDTALAAEIEAEGIPSFVDRWEALPLFATQTQLPARIRHELRQQRLRNNAVGLARSLRGMSVGRQACLRPHLRMIKAPVLLVTGKLDGKYCDLAREMAVLLPQAQLEIVPGAGHAVHLEQWQAFERIVREFLVTCARRTSGSPQDREEQQCPSRGSTPPNTKTSSTRSALKMQLASRRSP